MLNKFISIKVRYVELILDNWFGFENVMILGTTQLGTWEHFQCWGKQFVFQIPLFIYYSCLVGGGEIAQLVMVQCRCP